MQIQMNINVKLHILQYNEKDQKTMIMILQIELAIQLVQIVLYKYSTNIHTTHIAWHATTIGEGIHDNNYNLNIVFMILKYISNTTHFIEEI